MYGYPQEGYPQEGYAQEPPPSQVANPALSDAIRAFTGGVMGPEDFYTV